MARKIIGGARAVAASVSVAAVSAVRRANGNGNRNGNGRSILSTRNLFLGVIFLVCLWNAFRNPVKKNGLNFNSLNSGTDNDIGAGSGNGNRYKHAVNSSTIKSSSSTSSHASFNTKNKDVLYMDETALKNIQAIYQGASSRIEWSPRSLKDVTPVDEIDVNFQAIPLLATVDRRPIMVQKQLWEDEAANAGPLAAGGTLLGCAISSTTFVSNLESQYLKHYKEHQHTCDVCFQFSNREDMKSFVPGVGYEPLQKGQESVGTKCFGGKAILTARFADWQQKDERFQGYGYPWTVDCTLPNGIKELTCREISKMENSIGERDDIQNIYYKTRFVLDGWFGIWSKQFFVHSRWPWRGLMSHDDDRSKIAATMSKSWDDKTSDFVPDNVEDLKLAHVEGPVYDMTEFEEVRSLKSMTSDPSSRAGVHFRLVSNLFHLIRNAPGSTHMIAVVDGQANRSYDYLMEMLETKVSVLYKAHASKVFNDKDELRSNKLIPLSKMTDSKLLRSWSGSDMTLAELLRLRRIKIHMVPIITPSMAFEKSVCGGQYPFATFLAARFTPDYHVIMFIDGDTAMVEKSQTLQSVLYDRFFSENSSKCVGHRLRLIEQYVKPEYDNADDVLRCTQDLVSNKAKWDYAMENCHLKEGHIAARTDSIYAFSVHHPDTLPGYLSRGIEDCIVPGNKENDRYFLKESEFVQLHLRDRERKPECACFVNEAV